MERGMRDSTNNYHERYDDYASRLHDIYIPNRKFQTQRIILDMMYKDDLISSKFYMDAYRDLKMSERVYHQDREDCMSYVLTQACVLSLYMYLWLTWVGCPESS